jgi:hypothetical protein
MQCRKTDERVHVHRLHRTDASTIRRARTHALARRLPAALCWGRRERERAAIEAPGILSRAEHGGHAVGGRDTVRTLPVLLCQFFDAGLDISCGSAACSPVITLLGASHPIRARTSRIVSPNNSRGTRVDTAACRPYHMGVSPCPDDEGPD